MQQKTITREEAQKLVLNIPYEESTFFTVHFIKRTTGELRIMNCRRGVKKHLSGQPNSSGTLGLGYNAKSKNLLPVFDVQKGQYRSINCETIQKIIYRGTEYTVQEENPKE